MFKVLLQGGLGNQLFQVAAGIYLEKLSGQKVYFDESFLTKVPKKIRKREVEIRWLLDSELILKGNFRTLITVTLRDLFAKKILDERNLNDKVLDRLSSSTEIIRGYFHNFEYVDAIWETLAPKFKERFEETDIESKYNFDYLCIHFRGGDCLYGKGKTRHGIIGPGYIQDALETLKDKLKINKVIIVTDSPKFIKDRLDKVKGFDFSVISSSNIFNDLAIISRASGVVMSNSSFSWWGAFIADKFKNATVVAPYPWFESDNEEPKLLIPEHWTQIKRDSFFN
jgi:hypothetical protein